MKKPSSMVKMVVTVIAVVTLVLTLCQTAFAATEETLDVLAKNLAFQDPIKLVFAVDTTNSNAELLVWKEVPTEYTVQGEPAPSIFKPEGAATIGGKSCKTFYVSGLNAKEMTTDVYVCACVRDGDKVTYGKEVKYSILQYARNTIAKASTKDSLKVLLHNMLEYGASAQVNFEYNTNRLANASYYDIKVVGGAFPDKTQQGLYLEGDSVTMTAPATNGEKVFYYWKNSADTRVSYNASYTVTVGAANETYTAVYATVAEICAENGHDFELTPTAENLATEANCTESATYYKVCTLCGTKTEEAFVYGAPLGHTFDQEVEEEAFLVSDATCSSGAIYYYSCTCGEAGEETFTVGDPVAHFYTSTVAEGHLVSAATCTEAAVYRQSCSYCGVASASETFTNGAALGHDFGGFAVVTPKTCTTNGVEARACSRCEATEERAIPAGHVWSAFEVVTPATCNSAGESERQCSACGATEFQSIAATGHTYSEEWESDTESHWHPTTCEHTDVISGYARHSWASYGGKGTYRCTVCGRIKKNSVSVPTLTFTDNGTYATVTGVGGSGELLSVNIPETYNGLPVKYIDNYAFLNQTTLKTVILPSTLVEIRGGAFQGCTSLEMVKFNDGLETISGLSFKGCTALKSVTLPDTVALIGSEAFAGCTGLKAVSFNNQTAIVGSDSFPGNIESLTIHTDLAEYFSGSSASLQKLVITGGSAIGQNAFRGFSQLTTVSLPNTVTQIRLRAFGGCTSLTKISIPSSVTNIGDEAFYGTGLTRITLKGNTSLGTGVFKNCQYLTTVTCLGSLNAGDFDFENAPVSKLVLTAESCGTVNKSGFDKSLVTSVYVVSGTQLAERAFQLYPNLAVVKLPDTLTQIKQYAFHSCTSLTSIELPDALTSIGDYAFQGSGITSITIPSGVTSIGTDAFKNCASLAAVTFEEGTTTIGETIVACGGLRTVNIPVSVSEIESYAFYQTALVETVNYGGTMAEWNAINLRADWMSALHYTVHCTDGDITV